MRHFSIFVETDAGQGDYGGNSKCLFDGKDTQTSAVQRAQSFANLFKRKVELFAGRNIGRLIAQWRPE